MSYNIKNKGDTNMICFKPKNENINLKIDNETFKNKAEALETKIEDLETNNKAFIDEINVLNMEIGRLNGISTSETIILK